MAGLLDDDKKSWVGQAFDGIMGRLSEAGVVAKENLYPAEAYKEMVDAGVSGLRKIGVPNAVLDGRPTTTEDNFYKSTERAIENIPSQIPDFLKTVIDIGDAPIETGKGLLNALDGINTNLGDVFYNTLLPKKYEQPFKDYRTSLMSDKQIENEAKVAASTNSLLDLASTKQGRREIAQQNSLDLLGGYLAVPKNLTRLSSVNAAKIQNFADDNFPLPGGQTAGGFGSQMWSGRKSNSFDVEKYGQQAEAKAKAQRMFNEKGVTNDSIAETFKETNHFITPRGELVHHISDKDMEFLPLAMSEVAGLPVDVPPDTPVGNYKAKDLFAHDELFANYPELDDYNIALVTGKELNGVTGKVKLDANGKKYTSLEGSHSQDKKEITLYVDPEKGLTPRHLEVLVHEIQHGVQYADNLALGGDGSLQSMYHLQQGLQAEKALLNYKLGDPITSLAQEQKYNRRLAQIASGLDSLELVVKDTMTMSPNELKVNQSMRRSIYNALEGEWMARNTETEKKFYNALKETNKLPTNEYLDKLSPVYFMDDASSPKKTMLDYDDNTIDKMLKQMYEGALISSPNLGEFKKYMKTQNNESRRLLSETERSKGIMDGVYQDIDKRYGKNRKDDETLREAVNNRTITPDYKIEGADVDEPMVSLFDYAGRGLATSMADTSATGGFTTEVAGKELANKVARDGGQGFPFKFEGDAWASAQGALTNIVDSIENAGLLSTDSPVFGAFQMKAAGIDFNVQQTNSMVQSAIANLTEKELKKFDKLVRDKKVLKHYKDADGNKIKPSKKIKLNPKWVGIKNLDKDTLRKLNGDQRKDIQRILDSNFKNKIGTKLEHQLANADPSQLRTEPLSLQNIIMPDLSKGITESGHSTYSHKIAGKGEGRIKENVSLLDVIPVYDKEGVRITPATLEAKPSQYKSIMGQKISGLLTEENIDFAIKEAKKRAKKK
tara:strand:+ start:233 stop:3079 length:2847 start_codon:yes stop_codon:yes gene_type:complete